MKHLFKHVTCLLVLCLLCLVTITKAQTSSITITPLRNANPTLQWQGVSYYYGASTGTYSVTNGSEIYSYTDALTSTDKVGRYNFSHPGFTNSKIKTISLTVNCSAGNVTTSGARGLAAITIPQCNTAWSSSLTNAQTIGLYQCLSAAQRVKNTSGVVQSISTDVGGLSRTATYLIHDAASTVNSSALWDPASTSISIGFLPVQYNVTINSISMTITYTSDQSIENNSVCCAQSFGISGSAFLQGSTVSGGNGAYAYQWQSSSNNSTWANIAGATGVSYTTPTISQTMYYRRNVSSGTAPLNNSPSVKITIYPDIANNSICCAQSFINVSTPTPLTATTPTGGTGVYTYRWIRTLDGNYWTNIPGATNATYTPPAETQTIQYMRAVGSGTLVDHHSNRISVTITPGITGNSICCSQTYANTGDPAVLSQSSTATLIVGGAYSIQWESSINNTTWTAIAGETNATYDPPVTTQTIHYRRKITMTSGTIDYSNVVTINITTDTEITNNTICCNQTYSTSGDAPAFTQKSGTVLGGGNGTFSIQWFSSIDNNTWTALAGETNSSYDPPALTQTMYYNRVIISGTAPESTSNVVSVVVNALGTCTNTWIQKSPLAVNRYEGVTISMKGKLYVGLGTTYQGTTWNYNFQYLKDFWEYDLATESWTQKANYPGYGSKYTTAFTLNGKIYVGMGYGNAAGLPYDFYEYNPETNVWTRKADFPQSSLWYGSGFSLDNSGYVLFGQNGNMSTALWQYLPQDMSNGLDVNGNPKGAWVQKQNFPVGDLNSNYRGVAVIQGKAYGFIKNYGSTVSDYCYQYNPDDISNGCDAKGNPKGAWIRKSDPPGSLYKYTPLFVIGGKAYFRDYDGLIIYDAITNSFSSAPSPFGDNYYGAYYFSNNNIGYFGFSYTSEDPIYAQQKFWKFSPSNLVTGTVSTSIKMNTSFFPLPTYINVPYTVTCGTYPYNVTFTAQLSDVNGSFASPVNIGTVNSNSSGNIFGVLPRNTPTSNKYRVRVISTSPDQIGLDNGTDISITDKNGNKAGLYIDYENGFSKQWYNDATGKIAAHTMKDNDIYYKADLDGDGAQELIVVSYIAGSTTDYIDVLKFVKGDWTLLWSNNGSNSAGGGIYPYRNNLIVGDYDGDGKSELLGNDPGAGWTTLFKFANGNFQWAWSDYGNASHAIRPYKNKFYSGDFDGNGKHEIMGCSTGDWTTSFIWNGSDFVWSWSDYGGANPFRAYRNNMIAGDFDGDGKTELLGVGASLVIFDYNNGSWTQGWSSNGSNNIAGWSYPFASTDKVMSANIDADNKVELVLIQRGAGTEAKTLEFQNNQTGWSAKFQTTTFIGDWSVVAKGGTNTDYIMVKPKAGDPAYIMAIRKNCSYAAAMYKASNATFNYRIADDLDEETSISDEEELSVYPNPTEGEFYIRLQNTNMNIVVIYNANGQVVFEDNTIQSDAIQIASSAWGSGLYLIKVVCEDGSTKYSKIVVN